jgi:hypothetical protein
MPRFALLPPRPSPYPMRPLSSARCWSERLDPTVRKLDDTGIVLDMLEGPVLAGRMEHRWKSMEGGTSYDTSLTLGMTGPLLRPLVRRLAERRFDAHAWLRHNVEEVGLLEHLVPALSRQADVSLLAPPRPFGNV